jgi:hypothetical protein
MPSVIRTNPQLWDKIRTNVKLGSVGGPAGTWNARKAQIAVNRYKAAGGRYRGTKSSQNSLVIWTREKWGYIDNKKGNRYLPEKIRKRLTPAEKNVENKRKRLATKRGQQYAKYSASVLKKMQHRRPKPKSKNKRS